MQLSCPKCGSRDARVANRHGIGELLRGIFGVYPLRCRRCSTRWETSAWENSAWRYARCPKCYRQQLSTWSQQYYNAPFGTRVKLQLGATPYRCAACRCNFASFKRCKERFSWRQQPQQEDRKPATTTSPQSTPEPAPLEQASPEHRTQEQPSEPV